MSIALEGIDLPGIARGMTGGSAAFFELETPDERRINDSDRYLDSCSSSSTSSIGRNSDDDERSSDGEDCKEDEAQSAYKGPLDVMESLEEILPIRRGISEFYGGKSKSYTSLAEASSASSVKDIAKPENAYSRRQRILMASNLLWEKNRSFPLKGYGKGISKKPISSSKSSLALAMAMSSSDLRSSSSSSSTSEDSSSSPNLQSPSRLPPRHPQTLGSFGDDMVPKQGFSAWRSYSVADLPQCSRVSASDFKVIE